jgi:hypothetical protein
MPKRFGVFKNSSDPDVRIRNGLWSAAKTRRGDRPIVMPWHEGTKLALHLDNDLSYSLLPVQVTSPTNSLYLTASLSRAWCFWTGARIKVFTRSSPGRGWGRRGESLR